MAHEGLLNPAYTFTPVRTGSTVTSITVACTMYSVPFDPTGTNHYVDDNNQAQTIGTGCSDESQKVTLGSDSFTWSVPTAHQSTADPYKVNWKWIADKSQERQMHLITASADYKTMMNNLSALQLTH